MIEQDNPSRSIVERMIAPVTVDQFLASSWKRSALHVRGEPGRFGHLLGWDELGGILEQYPLEPPRIRLMRLGEGIPEERYYARRKSAPTINAGAVSMLLNEGATLIINFIDELQPAIAAIADAVADVLNARSWVNLYASWGTESGLALHADQHDVIVLQLAGCKQWTVYPATRTDSQEGDVVEPPAADAQPAWEGPLEDGDALYIPRGWSHVAVPNGKPSLHLTIGLEQPTGADFVRWLAKELDQRSELRGAVPQANDQAKDGWLDTIRDLVARSIDGDAVDAFLEREAASHLARPRFALPGLARAMPHQWSPGTAFRLAATRRLEVRGLGDGTVRVTSGNRTVTCSAAIAPALRSLSSAHARRLDQLQAAIGQPDVLELSCTLALMVHIGLLFTEI